MKRLFILVILSVTLLVFCSTPSNNISADESGDTQYYTKQEVNELIDSLREEQDELDQYGDIDEEDRCYYCGRTETEVRQILKNQINKYFGGLIEEQKDHLSKVDEYIDKKIQLKLEIIALAGKLPDHILQLKYSTILNDVETFSSQYPELNLIVEYRNEIRKDIDNRIVRNISVKASTAGRNEDLLHRITREEISQERNLLEEIDKEKRKYLYVSNDRSLNEIITLLKQYTPKSIYKIQLEEDIRRLQNLCTSNLTMIDSSESMMRISGTSIVTAEGNNTEYRQFKELVERLIRQKSINFDHAYRIAEECVHLRKLLDKQGQEYRARNQRRYSEQDEKIWNELYIIHVSEEIKKYIDFEFFSQLLPLNRSYPADMEINYNRFLNYYFDISIPVRVKICRICSATLKNDLP